MPPACVLGGDCWKEGGQAWRLRRITALRGPGGRSGGRFCGVRDRTSRERFRSLGAGGLTG